jgi:hypothetical protein
MCTLRLFLCFYGRLEGELLLYLHTTPTTQSRSWVLRLFKEFSALYFNTVFTKGCHFSLSWTISIHSHQPFIILPLSRACQMLHPSLGYPNIYYGMKIWKIHIMQFLHLLSSSFLGRIFSWTPSAYVLPIMWETKFQTHIKTSKIIFFLLWCFGSWIAEREIFWESSVDCSGPLGVLIIAQVYKGGLEVGKRRGSEWHQTVELWR